MSEWSLHDPAVFRRVVEDEAQYGLRPEDRTALLRGRDSVTRYMRLGFLLGATLAPLPLFRGKYAIKSLASLPPLISRTSQKPDIAAIQARMWWLAKAVTVTFGGTIVGSRVGFHMGIRSMETTLEGVPGARQRVRQAFELARKDPPTSSALGSSPDAEHQRPAVNPGDQSLVFAPDEELRSQQTYAEQDLQQPGTSTSSSPAPLPSPSGQSRWEELRREKGVGPSTWDAIRQQRARAAPPNQPSEPLDSREAERRAFEELLERERKMSNDGPGASTARTSRWS